MTPQTAARAAAPPRQRRLVNVELDPHHARVAARQLREAGRPADATMLETALERGDKVEVRMPPQEAFEFAQGLHRLGHFKRALPLYREILGIEPDNAQVMHYLGVALHQGGQSEDALQHLQGSMSGLEEYAWAWNNLGNVLKETGRRDDAETAYRNAIALDPGHVEAYSNLGSVLRLHGAWVEAKEAFDAALALNPDFSDAHYNKGKLLLAQGKLPESIDSLNRAIVTAPRGSGREARITLARAHASLGELDKAAEVFRKLMEDEPDNPVLRHMLMAYSQENVPDRASDEFVSITFDRFAASFDAKLRILEYRAPPLVVEAFEATLKPGETAGVVLDAGCGTGLCGPLMRERVETLVGVDLSPNMLAKAASRKMDGRPVYDQLEVAELTAWLQGRSDAYDSIISADTLCYFGALEDFARASFSSLKAGGSLVFTVEALPDDSAPSYRLEPHGRYAHRRDYVEKALADAGFSIAAVAKEQLRKENGRPVMGWILTAIRDP